MRILFITSTRVGDAVLSTGVLAYLADQHPEARFTVACGAVSESLFTAMPFVERVIPIVKRKWNAHWWDLWRQTVPTSWRMVVDLRGSALGWALWARHRRVLHTSSEQRHRLFHLANVLKLERPPSPRLWATEAQRRTAAEKIPQGTPVLALGPTANWGGKIWPGERFLETALQLTSPAGLLPGARIAVFSSDSERALALPVLEGLPEERRLDLIGGMDLPTLYACLQRCAFYLGNDSGPMHIAAAAGIPTLGLFGPSPEALYGPWGERTASVRGPERYEQIWHAPGFDPKLTHSRMTSLDVETVINAAKTLWDFTAKNETPPIM